MIELKRLYKQYKTKKGTVTGVDDRLVDGTVAYKVVTAPAVSSDAAYNRLDAADVTLTNLDNDVQRRVPIIAPPAAATAPPSQPLMPTGATGAAAVAFAALAGGDGDMPSSGSGVAARPRARLMAARNR